MRNGAPKAVIMADDDEEDCLLATEAFAYSGSDAGFSCVEDGIKLMEYLEDRSRAAPGRLPNLILLDLNMPRKDGRRALLEIQSDPALRHIPIVILTTSKEQRDIDSSLEAGAKSFITKPGTFDQWIEIMKSLAENWLN